MNLIDPILAFDGCRQPEVLAWGKGKFDRNWYLAPQIMGRHAFIIMTHGHALFYLDKIPYRIQDGDILLIRKGQLLAGEEAPHEPLECAWIHFAPLPEERLLTPAIARAEHRKNHSRKPVSAGDGLFLSPDSRWRKLYLPVCIRLLEAQPDVMRLVETGLMECQRPSTGSSLRASLCLSELFVLITRHTLPCLQEKGEKASPPAIPSLLQDAVFMIRSDYTQPLTVQSVAERLRVTPQHLIRVFRKCLKISPLEYIHSVRMEQAREMLQLSRLSIKEICLASGFRDRHHFAHLFSKIHGCPPTVYRETKRRTK